MTWSSYRPAGTGQIVKIIGEPVGGLGQGDEAVLDRRGLGVQAHDLVAVRLLWRDLRKADVQEVLDQLGS